MKKVTLFLLSFSIFISTIFTSASAQNIYFAETVRDIIQTDMNATFPSAQCKWRKVAGDATSSMHALTAYGERQQYEYIFIFENSTINQRLKNIDLFVLYDQLILNYNEESLSHVASILSTYLELMYDTRSFDVIQYQWEKFMYCFLDYADGRYSSTHKFNYNGFSLSIKCERSSHDVTISFALPTSMTVAEYSTYYSFTTKYQRLTPGLYATLRQKYGDDPEILETYFEFFDQTWGELVESEGEIVYSTLTEKQRNKINFPKLNIDEVWFVENGRSYHSTYMCYTLAKSDDIYFSSLDGAISNGYSMPCSKCVDY